MQKSIKVLFFALLIKPIIFVILGLNIKGRSKLPKSKAVIAANHNSHLDTLVLMSLYPLRDLYKVRPVAAADYFMRNPVVAWLSINCLGIIALDRSGSSSQDELFNECRVALAKGEVLILFPEGSRGTPEKMTKLKKGLFYLLKDQNNVAVTPVAMQGLGLALPKGEALFVPLNCDVAVGDSIEINENSKTFNLLLQTKLDLLFESLPKR